MTAEQGAPRFADLVEELDHICVAVPSIDDALGLYRDVLGFEVAKDVVVEERQLRIAFIRVGHSEIELIQPLSPDNTVTRFLERRGPGLHHFCFRVRDIQAAMQALRERGARFVEDEAKTGAVGMVAFIHPEFGQGVLVELNEPFVAGGSAHG
ncbi:MAG: methylmalonyl-CoA epimerase [Chloroflexi bacterium]|nr:methylmalonyl-CoA epimerase [Chloroflexota bacterium]